MDMAFLFLLPLDFASHPASLTMTHSDHHLTQPSSEIEAQHSLGLRIIAIYKAIKTVCLIVVAVAAFRLIQPDRFHHLLHWLEHLPLTDSNGLRWKLVDLLEQMGPSKFVAVGIVALGYAAIFATEGIGLWLRKHWAEWFTVIATGSLIPLELYESVAHFTWLKLAALVANVAIVVYLVRIAMQPRPPKHTSDT